MNAPQRTPASPALRRCWDWLAPGGLLGGRFVLVVGAALAASWLLYFAAEGLIVSLAAPRPPGPYIGRGSRLGGRSLGAAAFCRTHDAPPPAPQPRPL